MLSSVLSMFAAVCVHVYILCRDQLVFGILSDWATVVNKRDI